MRGAWWLWHLPQAYTNVMMGPWEKMTDGYGNMVLGYYGKTPVPPDPEIVEIAAEQLKKPVFTGDPIKDLEPGIPKAKKVLEDNALPVTDENLFIIGAFATKSGNKGVDFLKGNFKVSVPKKVAAAPAPAAAPAAAVPAPVAPIAAETYHVTISGQSFDVHVQPG